jgi:hypothetical protein
MRRLFDGIRPLKMEVQRAGKALPGVMYITPVFYDCYL